MHSCSFCLWWHKGCFLEHQSYFESNLVTRGLSGLNELYQGSRDTTAENATAWMLDEARPLSLRGYHDCISDCIIKPGHTVLKLNCCHLHPRRVLSNFQFVYAMDLLQWYHAGAYNVLLWLALEKGKTFCNTWCMLWVCTASAYLKIFEQFIERNN